MTPRDIINKTVREMFGPPEESQFSLADVAYSASQKSFYLSAALKIDQAINPDEAWTNLFVSCSDKESLMSLYNHFLQQRSALFMNR